MTWLEQYETEIRRHEEAMKPIADHAIAVYRRLQTEGIVFKSTYYASLEFDEIVEDRVYITLHYRTDTDIDSFDVCYLDMSEEDWTRAISEHHKERERKEQEEKARIQAEQEARERTLYEKLKAKYG